MGHVLIMKQIISKKIESGMSTNTTGFASQISGVLNKVYSISHGSGTAIWAKDEDGQIYEIDIRPAKFGNFQEEAKKFLMLSENDGDKDTLRTMKRDEANPEGSAEYMENMPQ